MAEVAVQRQWFSDNNAIGTAYVRLLGPIVRKAHGSLLLGYGASRQNAEQSRFVLAQPTQSSRPGDPRYNTAGEYLYYTPIGAFTHSALGSASYSPTPLVTMRLDGSYGVWARENAPAFQVIQATSGSPASLARSSTRRAYSPWSARAAMNLGPFSGFHVALTAEKAKTAFHSRATGGVRVAYHLVR